MIAEFQVLERHGYRPAGGGDISLRGPGVNLFRTWNAFLLQLLRPLYTETIQAPLFLEREALAAAGYLDHFPQQVVEAGNAMSPTPSGRFLTPAACFHIYPSLAGQSLDGQARGYLIEARCARHEAGEWRFPFHLAGFHMLEFVAAGSLPEVTRLRDEAENLVRLAFADLGVEGKFAPATDAFFLGNDESARLIQKLKGLKQEYVVECAGQQVALASINSHEEYFGRRFNIRAAGETAHSCCVAFGLERLTAYTLLRWGGEPSGWPAELQS